MKLTVLIMFYAFIFSLHSENVFIGKWISTSPSKKT